MAELGTLFVGIGFGLVALSAFINRAAPENGFLGFTTLLYVSMSTAAVIGLLIKDPVKNLTWSAVAFSFWVFSTALGGDLLFLGIMSWWTKASRVVRKVATGKSATGKGPASLKDIMEGPSLGEMSIGEKIKASTAPMQMIMYAIAFMIYYGFCFSQAAVRALYEISTYTLSSNQSDAVPIIHAIMTWIFFAIMFLFFMVVVLPEKFSEMAEYGAISFIAMLSGGYIYISTYLYNERGADISKANIAPYTVYLYLMVVTVMVAMHMMMPLFKKLKCCKGGNGEKERAEDTESLISASTGSTSSGKGALLRAGSRH